MGQSTDAYLFYGVEIHDGEGSTLAIWEEEDPNEEEDLETFVLDKLSEAGISGVNVGYHCSGEYPIYYIYTEQFRAWRGEAARLHELSATISDISVLQKALKVLGVEVDAENTGIGWWLASYWGC